MIRQYLSKLKNYREQRRVNRLDLAWSKIPVSSTLKSVHEGKVGAAQRKLCLFANWDPHGRIDPYVLYYLERIRDSDFDIHLISTSENLDSTDLARALKICTKVIHRSNMGLDFASWALALSLEKNFARYERVLLANDSLFGPFGDLGKIFARFESSSNLYFGLTDNWEKFYHAQSYFLYFKEEFIRSEFWQSFWNNLQLHYDKEKIIMKYEVGLSHSAIQRQYYPGLWADYYTLREHCLKMQGAFQYDGLIRTQPCNSTIFMWDVLIQDFGFPFLKTEILKLNRKGSNKVVYWPDYIPADERHHVDLILNHLKRIALNCPA